jgi:CMP-N,N'-diacetyllegionaminic acid synthase
MSKIIAIIPARSGSKSILNKNIRMIQNKPLIAYTIEQALMTKSISEVIVSTDSLEYAKVAKEYGANVPFLRPKEFAEDLSTDLEVFMHALNFLEKEKGCCPDIIVHLRPTYPLRKIDDIEECIKLLLNNPNVDSLRTISKSKETPYKMWFKDENNILSPVVGDLISNEFHSMPRQLLPTTYLQNACIDVIRASCILQKKSMTGDSVLGYVMEQNHDIDYEKQFQFVNNLFKIEKSKSTFCFDIDGVIASIIPDNDYAKSTPIIENIDLINSLFINGNYIILNTARGSKTGLDWIELTEIQMKKWGVLYHELIVGVKPSADFYIDDKFIDIEILKQIVNS